MKRMTYLLLVLLIIFGSKALALVPFLNGVIAIDSTGDSPLTTVFTWQGHGNWSE
jgi:hypothetical protein